ncbi:MAG: hypothetical protein ACR2I1_07335, partial [Propionibacteriaceae bacterium]
MTSSRLRQVAQIFRPDRAADFDRSRGTDEWQAFIRDSEGNNLVGLISHTPSRRLVEPERSSRTGCSPLAAIPRDDQVGPQIGPLRREVRVLTGDP